MKQQLKQQLKQQQQGAGAGAGAGDEAGVSAPPREHIARSAVAAQGHAQVNAYEVDADRRDVALSIRVVSKAQQQAGLADTRVADQHELEHVVILLRCGGRHRARSVGKERRRAETRARATAALAGHGWMGESCGSSHGRGAARGALRTCAIRVRRCGVRDGRLRARRTRRARQTSAIPRLKRH